MRWPLYVSVCLQISYTHTFSLYFPFLSLSLSRRYYRVLLSSQWLLRCINMAESCILCERETTVGRRRDRRIRGLMNIFTWVAKSGKEDAWTLSSVRGVLVLWWMARSRVCLDQCCELCSVEQVRERWEMSTGARPCCAVWHFKAHWSFSHPHTRVHKKNTQKTNPFASSSICLLHPSRLRAANLVSLSSPLFFMAVWGASGRVLGLDWYVH